MKFANKHKANVVTICAAIEAEIAELDDNERLEFLKELGLKEPGLNRVVQAGYQLLQLQTCFTLAPKKYALGQFLLTPPHLKRRERFLLILSVGLFVQR